MPLKGSIMLLRRPYKALKGLKALMSLKGPIRLPRGPYRALKTQNALLKAVTPSWLSLRVS